MRYVIGFIVGVLFMAAVDVLQDLYVARTVKTPARTAPATRRISL